MSAGCSYVEEHLKTERYQSPIGNLGLVHNLGGYPGEMVSFVSILDTEVQVVYLTQIHYFYLGPVVLHPKLLLRHRWIRSEETFKDSSKKIHAKNDDTTGTNNVRIDPTHNGIRTRDQFINRLSIKPATVAKMNSHTISLPEGTVRATENGL